MSKETNYSGSMNDVVDTIGPSLQVFINEVVKEEMPDCKFVYDPNLSYETAIKKLRENSQMNQDLSTALPLFVFRRSNLRWPEDGIAPNRRLTSAKAISRNLSDGKAIIYTPIFAEYDLEFLYINKNMEDIEKFEITYLSDEGISGTRQYVVRLPELGDFNHFAEYNELSSLEVNYEENFFKGLIGTIKIRGMFFTFRSESPIIKQISANYRSWLDSVDLKPTSILKEQIIIGE
jgi:hypothetical protein